MTYAYGPGSAGMHLADLRRRRQPAHCMTDPDFAFDIDTSDDLADWLGHAWPDAPRPTNSEGGHTIATP